MKIDQIFNEVISIVLNEESHQKMMLSTQDLSNIGFMVKPGHIIKSVADPIYQPFCVQRKNQKNYYIDNL